MHGRWEGEERKRRRHRKCPLPVLGTTVAASDSTTSTTATATSTTTTSSVTSQSSFYKNGRKIHVGDCALFKPLQDMSPAFIGIIRSLTIDKENHSKLGVNWLYRPFDVKLGKGILPETTPNEIFYSFHKDEIPAASLLHPCKVAFLRKGVQLPQGISSYVCWRVYDTSNKCLWWLTDQDYINERQEEVDKLLDKTRLEMHAAVQSGGRSPKPLSGSTSTQQLKPGSDGAQNSGCSSSSQIKCRKRDRTDQGSEIIKKERCTRTDDEKSCQSKFECTLKSEIAKITEKGGVVNFEGVAKLVQLMRPAAKKLDLAGRMMLADVLTVTDKYDCLGKFVQLKGLSVLDEWLQEVHKGKIGDGSISKESDISIEDFLFALLRALDRLPVDLHALQTCNVGKSVNHLRSHKNVEIQKKARTLVDTWKKRVEAEMNMNDAKSGPSYNGSWPHGGNKRGGGASEVPIKNSATQPSICKASPVKLSQGDSTSKFVSSPGSAKFSPPLPAPIVISKDSPTKIRVGASDLPLSTIREEKSSSSSQSQNNSQSCSSDHAKPICSLWKDDVRSSSKTLGSAARHCKSSNDTVGSSVSGVQKENTSIKCGPVERKATSEKVLQDGLTCEKAVDMPPGDNGNNHRLIVRLPNLGRITSRSVSVGSLDDSSVVVSRVSSPRFPESHVDQKVKAKDESFRSNIPSGIYRELRDSSGVKDGLAGSDECDESHATPPEELHGTGVEVGKALETSKTTCSSSVICRGDYLIEPKPGMSHEASLRSINILIESCVNYSEAISTLPTEDECGMNLLASVAAGELSKCEQVSPVVSPRLSSAQEDSYTVNDSKELYPEDVAVQSQGELDDRVEGDCRKHISVVGQLLVKADKHGTSGVSRKLFEEASSSKLSEDSRTSSLAEERSTSYLTKQSHVSIMDLQQSDNPCLKGDARSDEVVPSPVSILPVDSYGVGNRTSEVICQNGDGHQELVQVVETSSRNKVKCTDEKIAENITFATGLGYSSAGDACVKKYAFTGVKVEKEAIGKSLPCVPSETNDDKKIVAWDQSVSGITKSTIEHSDLSSASGNVMDTNSINPKIDNVETETHMKQNEGEGICPGSMIEDVCNNTAVGVGVDSLDHRNSVLNSERKDINVGFSVNENSVKNSGEEVNRMYVKALGIDTNQPEECVSTAGASSSTRSEMAPGLDFDLNEGFPAEESEGDLDIPAAPGCSTVVSVRGPSSSVPSLSKGLPLAPVAATSKGPFVPPTNLLRNSGEIGWKGSAATSAFRPAEPRKVLEMSLATTDIPLKSPSNKQGRPPLDIDLNEPDDRLPDDMSQCSAQAMSSVSGFLTVNDNKHKEGISSCHAPVPSVSGLDLDLNRVGEATETGQGSSSTGRQFGTFLTRQSLAGGFSNGEVNVPRNFDLNNGPGFDEAGVDHLPIRQHLKGSLPFIPSVPGIRMSTADFGSLSSWFPPGSTYPAVSFSSILQDRGEQTYPVSTAGAQRILGPPTAGITFGPDGYRGPVLSSSALAFPPGTPFPYPGFSFGTNFRHQSTDLSSGSTMYLDSSSAGGLCFPTIPSQLVGASNAVSSYYPRPYMISLPDAGITGATENNRRQSGQALDLNAGPCGTGIEGRDERLPAASRHHSTASSQTLAEEQMRMYQAAGAAMKRKEPQGGWDVERVGYKHPSWK